MCNIYSTKKMSNTFQHCYIRIYIKCLWFFGFLFVCFLGFFLVFLSGLILFGWPLFTWIFILGDPGGNKTYIPQGCRRRRQLGAVLRIRSLKPKSRVMVAQRPVGAKQRPKCYSYTVALHRQLWRLYMSEIFSIQSIRDEFSEGGGG